MWVGVYVRDGHGYEVTTFRARKDGQPDGRGRPLNWGVWTPAAAHGVLNSPDTAIFLAAPQPEMAALRDALRRLAAEPDYGGV